MRNSLFPKFNIFSILIILLTQTIFAQNDSLYSIDYFLENIIEDISFEDENSQIYDLIEQYIEKPIDLNSSNLIEIIKLPFIDIQIANAIVEYRDKHGKIFSYSELNSINTISEKSIKILQIFTYLKIGENNVDSSFWRNLKVKTRSTFSQSIQKAEGYKNRYYKGTPNKIYNRMLINHNLKIQIGLLADKDAGEKSIADFQAYYFQANNLLKGLKLLLGFYTMEFGQGLSLWSPYAFAKGSDATNSIIKHPRGISPYASSGEYLYMKGAAFQYSSNYFELSSFYSNEKDYFNLLKSTFGFIASFSPFPNLKLSSLYMKENEKYFNNITFSDNYLTTEHTSFTYQFTFDKLFTTGEFAFFNKSIASINTLQISLFRTFLVVASFRNYPNTYQSMYGQGFGETKNTNNEFGIYFGLKWRTEFGAINLYFDQFKFPNSTSSIALPSSGNELSFSYEISLFPKTDFYFRFFSENKEVLELFGNENIVANRKTDRLRFELKYEVNKNITLKSRVELLSINQFEHNENGILLFEDIKLLFDKFSIYGRIVFFQTDSFASRIYEFENDLSGIMVNPALYNSGIKWYLFVKYKPFNNLYFSAKYSELYKPNEMSIGTGNNLIKGNIDNKFSIQIDFAF